MAIKSNIRYTCTNLLEIIESQFPQVFQNVDFSSSTYHLSHVHLNLICFIPFTVGLYICKHNLQCLQFTILCGSILGWCRFQFNYVHREQDGVTRGGGGFFLHKHFQRKIFKNISCVEAFSGGVDSCIPKPFPQRAKLSLLICNSGSLAIAPWVASASAKNVDAHSKNKVPVVDYTEV